MNKILAIFSALNKIIDKFPDGNIKIQARAEIKKAELLFLMKLSPIIGFAIVSIYLNFFLSLAFIDGYLSKATPANTISLILLILATKFIFNLDMKTIKDVLKIFKKDFWKQ